MEQLLVTLMFLACTQKVVQITDPSNVTLRSAIPIFLMGFASHANYERPGAIMAARSHYVTTSCLLSMSQSVARIFRIFAIEQLTTNHTMN